jgi:hypothetical protein
VLLNPTNRLRRKEPNISDIVREAISRMDIRGARSLTVTLFATHVSSRDLFRVDVVVHGMASIACRTFSWLKIRAPDA